MKKLISLLLAVSVLALSTCASAASLKADGQRNPGGWNNETCNSYYLRDNNSNKAQHAVYQPGDTITFSKGDGVTFAAGDVVTFISSKLNEEDLNSSTVMFIDQITIDSASPTFSYKVREGLAEGVYKIDIKVGSADVDTFYYGVADPKVETIEVADGKNYHVQEFNGEQYAFYFAAVTFNTSELVFRQFANDFGVKIGEETFTFGSTTHFDTNAGDNLEIGGAKTFIYTLPVLLDDANLDPADLTVEGYIDEKVAQ